MKRYIRCTLNIIIITAMIISIAAGCSTASNDAPSAGSPDQEASSPDNSTDNTSNEDSSPGNIDLTGQELRVGVSCGITGDAPLEGERISQAVNMAFEEANEAGGIYGAKLVAVIQDDANIADNALNVNNMFGSDDSILASIGPHRSSNLLAVEQTALRFKIPVLSGGTTPKFYELDNPYIFRIRGSDTLVAKIAAQFAIDNLGSKKIALMYNNDDYGNGALEVIKEYLSSIGSELVAAEAHNTGDKDMTGQLLNCKNVGADVIIGWTHVPEAAIMARQFKELGLDKDMEFVGCPTWANTAFFQLVDESVPDGVYATVDFADSNPDPFASDFTKRFEEKYGVVPENMSGCYYDAALILIDSIRRAAESGEITRESIRQALADQPPITGNQGSLFASGIDMVHQTIIVQNEGAKPRYIDTVVDVRE